MKKMHCATGNRQAVVLMPRHIRHLKRNGSKKISETLRDLIDRDIDREPKRARKGAKR